MILQNSKNAWYFLNQGLTAVYYSQFKKAVSKFNKAISLDPENIVAQFHKGTTLYKMENFQNAIICFDHVLSTDPKNLDALYNKGLALEKIEKYKEAISSFKKYLCLKILQNQASIPWPLAL